MALLGQWYAQSPQPMHLSSKNRILSGSLSWAAWCRFAFIGQMVTHFLHFVHSSSFLSGRKFDFAIALGLCSSVRPLKIRQAHVQQLQIN